jgi:hypothetical protein
MAQPVWNTPAGSIGSFPALLPMAFQLSASAVLPASNVSYTLLSGTLPSGLSISQDGLISGTPTLVTRNTLSTFAVRVTDNLQSIRDRTFSINVSGSAVPQFTTPNGSLLSTQDSLWLSLPITYTNPSTSNPVVVQVKEGTLPPGLEIDLLGNIRGYANPPIITLTSPSVVTTASDTTGSTNLITVTSTVVGNETTYTVTNDYLETFQAVVTINNDWQPVSGIIPTKVPSAVSGVDSAGFKTTVFPAANAGAIFQAAIKRGKFQGMI